MRKISILFFCILAVATSACSKVDNSQYIPTFTDGLGFLNKEPPQPEPEPEPEILTDKMLKVISLNVKTSKGDAGKANSWASRKQAVLAMFQVESPHVFGLQECRLDQLNDLAQGLSGYDHVGVCRDDGTTTGTGEYLAVFWKTSEIQKVEWGTFWLSPTPGYPSKGWDESDEYVRSTTWAVFKHIKTGKHFFFMNTHLSLVDENRRNGFILLESRIKALNPSQYPAVLVGDFNQTSPSLLMEPIESIMSDLRQVAPKTDKIVTYNNFGGGSKRIIDFIFFSDFHALKYRTINNSWLGVTYISDHYPISGTLEFRIDE